MSMKCLRKNVMVQVYCSTVISYSLQRKSGREKKNVGHLVMVRVAMMRTKMADCLEDTG